MKRLITLTLAFGTLVFTTACNKTIDVENGELPESLLPFAEKHLGNYDGHFAGKEISFNLRLEGKKLVLEPSKAFLPESCDSQIGDLTAVSVKRKKKETRDVIGVDFAFNPNRCRNQIWGRALELYFSKDADEAHLELFEYRRIYQDCNPYPRGGTNCHTEQHEEYLRGSFRKTN